MSGEQTPPAPHRRRRLADTLAAFKDGGADRQIFDVVIVGSGYGGSIAAWFLSQCRSEQGEPLKVCLLERGNEFLPGDFPSTFAELPRELRVARQQSGEVEGTQGLFDLRLGDDVMALVANGLGGGSLINAGVMLEPDAADHAHAPFGETLAKLKRGGHFELAKRLLGAQVKRSGQWINNDADRWRTEHRKTKALGRLAERDGKPLRRPTITVSIDGQPSFSNTMLKACNHCGDCMTGCNFGAKDSLDMGLLSAACRSDTAPVIVTGATVTSVVRKVGKDHADASGWELRVAHTDAKLQLREGYPLRLKARRVILAAGALGSPEILLRSRDDSLSFSGRLGQAFSCNGDNIGAVRGLPDDANGRADEDHDAAKRSVGPTITASVRLKPAGGHKPFELQEFSVPGPLARLFDETVTTAFTIQKMPTADPELHTADQSDPLAVDEGAMRKTLLVGVIGHDAANGTLVLARPTRPVGKVPQMGALRIVWPLARDGAELHAAHDRVAAFVHSPRGPDDDAKGATFVANPMWRLLPPELSDLVSQPRGPVLTVHPLGGCGIGVSAADGVVDDCGRVFDAAAGAGKHGAWEGTLVVLDGSIVPTSLGANPALTISALTLRALDALTKDWNLPGGPDLATLCDPTMPAQSGKVAQYDGPPAPLPPSPKRQTEVTITERQVAEIDLWLGPREQRRRAVVELTLAFKPTALRTLVGPARPAVELLGSESYIRVWDAETWHQFDLRYAKDHERAACIAWHAPLTGSLRFLHREPSTRWGRTLRGARAWLCNRGLRDLWQEWWIPRFTAQGRADRAARQEARATEPRLTARSGSNGKVSQFFALASRAGEVRLFDYALSIGSVTVAKPDWAPPVGACTVLGEKRLTYNRRANPWRQLTELRLTQMPGLRATDGTEPILKLDPRFLVAQSAPLLAVTYQRNHAEALAELVSLGLYFFRVVASVHLWTFRKPDMRPPGVPQRLPGNIRGLPAPQVIDLIVDRWPADSATPGAPLSIRLTRYARPASTQPPLVMIHGYSVSGNTFTHPALKPSAAEWFWRNGGKPDRNEKDGKPEGRDVWIVDLRSSSGLASATYPWAMEQAALIDIPAALLHIRQATGKRVDVLAHCIGCAMLSMAVLSDASSVRNGNLELGVGTWLTSEHFGTLTAFNGVAPSGGKHPTIKRIVLSQKGPLLRYTDANVLRAHVMQYARRLLLQGDYQFTPSDDPGVAEQLIDRLLASLPYPDADYDIENPRRPCATTPWTATRHRMDALYGRDFSADNMSDDVLRAIDDLFGPINLDTVSQTIHFARFSAITNQRGRGEFVTRQRLKQHWGQIPTFAIHGRDNGLIDAATEDLMLEEFGRAGLREFFRAHTYDGMGHQDMLIGLRATEVFSDIELFLKGCAREFWRQPKESDPAPKFVAIAPWVGPRVLPPDTAFPGGNGAPRIGCMSRPDQGEAELWLAPVWRHHPPGKAVSFDLLPSGCWVKGEAGPSGRWLRAQPRLDRLMREVSGTPECELGWLAVFAYPGDQVTAMALRDPQPALHVDVPAATKDLLEREPMEVIERSFVRLADLSRVSALSPDAPWSRPLRFAVASCQYPNGLFDPEPAGASLLALARRGDVDLALMLGDQIYADATAGLLDPTRSDERYQQPNERALRTPAMAALMRRIPIRALLDDHEIENNWEPLPDTAKGPAAEKEKLRLAEARRLGMAAFFRFQRPELGGHQSRQGPADADLCFEAGGHAFLLLDTRTARSRGGPGGAAMWSLIDANQFLRLEAWMEEHRNQVKFIATPSLLLPRRALSAVAAQNAVYSDSWCGYPGGLNRLLQFIADKGIGKTVFLSGDEHHSMFAEVTLHGSLGADPVRVLSVHSSALYAPFPFGNGRRRDLLECDKFRLGGVNDVEVRVKTTWAPPGDGFAVLHVGGSTLAPVLQVEFCKADGASSKRFDTLL